MYSLGKTNLACSAGQSPRYNGSAWTCATLVTGYNTETDPTVNALGKATLSCSSGQVVKWNGSSWACAADTDTDTNTDIYWTGTSTNLVPATARTSLGLNALASATLSCSSGQTINWNGSAWVCYNSAPAIQSFAYTGTASCDTGGLMTACSNPCTSNPTYYRPAQSRSGSTCSSACFNADMSGSTLGAGIATCSYN